MRPKPHKLMSEQSRINNSLPMIPAMSIAIVLLATTSAEALQPLDAFLDAAREGNMDRREAEASAARLQAEARRAWSRLLPSVSAEARYTRNQIESVARLPSEDGTFRESVLSPRDQRDAEIRVELPLVDVERWLQIARADHAKDAGDARREATVLEVERQVALAYYQLVAAEALRAASERTLAAAEQNLATVEERQRAGFAGEVDVKRALAEVERDRQSLANAQLAIELSRRALRTLSGLEPALGAPSESEGDRSGVGELASWESELEEVPVLRAAKAEVESAESTKTAAYAAFLPGISARGSERFTNATGFGGESPTWSISVVAEWRLDAGLFPSIDAAGYELDAAQAREERTRRASRDRVHEAWHRAKTEEAKARAAKAQLEASRLGAALAKERYEAGTATLLDVIVAERDAYGAEVGLIQAGADLDYSRALLAISAGRSISERRLP
jgi:outer membrane protein TolC